jgi:hypothetical protein
MHGVFNAGFLLFHFGFGCGANLDHRHASDQLGQPQLQLLAVIVAGALLDLATKSLRTSL